MITIRINTWYDVVSPESRTEGDYESTGNDFRSFEYNEQELEIAIFELSRIIRDMQGVTGNVSDMDTLVGMPELDYRTGNEFIPNCSVTVEGGNQLERQLIREKMQLELAMR